MTTEWIDAFTVADPAVGTAITLPKVGWLFMIDVGGAIVDVALPIGGGWTRNVRSTGQIVINPPHNLQQPLDAIVRCYYRTAGRIEISRDYDPDEQRD